MFALFTFSAAALAGLAALLGLWPFAGVQAVVTTIVYGDPSTPIQATTLFPAVPPVHKVVDVYDPPPASAQPRPPSSAPGPARPSPSSEPSDGAEPGDN